MPKNDGIFREIVFVGVRGYGREQFHEKQAMARFSRWEPHHFHTFYIIPAKPKIFFVLVLLAVDRGFSTVCSEKVFRLSINQYISHRL